MVIYSQLSEADWIRLCQPLALAYFRVTLVRRDDPSTGYMGLVAPLSSIYNSDNAPMMVVELTGNSDKKALASMEYWVRHRPGLHQQTREGRSITYTIIRPFPH